MSYVSIKRSYWNDPYIYEAEFKLASFYLFLITNPLGKTGGIYTISLRQIKDYTRFTEPEILKLLETLSKDGKITYNEATGELALKNALKNNVHKADTVLIRIQKEHAEVKDQSLVEWVKSAAQEVDVTPRPTRNGSGRKAPSKVPDLDTEQRFIDFMKLYGKPDGEAQAKKEFLKLDSSYQIMCLQKAPIYAKRWPDPKYRKNAAAWLREKMYLDNIDIPAPPPEIGGATYSSPHKVDL